MAMAAQSVARSHAASMNSLIHPISLRNSLKKKKKRFDSCRQFLCKKRKEENWGIKGLKERCQRRVNAIVDHNVEDDEMSGLDSDDDTNILSIVMKFGGSSVASAERMREVADLILSFPEERPVIVLSAMGRTTNKLLVVCSVDQLNFV